MIVQSFLLSRIYVLLLSSSLYMDCRHCECCLVSHHSYTVCASGGVSHPLYQVTQTVMYLLLKL